MNYKLDRKSQRKVVGLIPAAGRAARIKPLPCSKELFPVGFRLRKGEHNASPKVVCHYLLEKMRLAGVTTAYIILRKGKWDIPAYLDDGSMLGMHLAYLMMGLPYGVPFTIDQAYPFVKDAEIVFGFPDILFEPDDAFVQLLSRQTISHCDVVLGLFPADRPSKVDMLDLAHDGRVREIIIKPRKTQLQLTWGIAVWGPTFTLFMHQYLKKVKDLVATRPELFIGEVINASIHEGLKVEAVQVSEKPFLDIGTVDDLQRAVKRWVIPAV